MLEDSDKSDSWGSILMNGILSKINQMSGKNNDVDHENHLLIGSKRPQISKEVSEKMVDKKIIMKGQYPKKKRYTSVNKFTADSAPEYADWCDERQKMGYNHRIDLTEKKKGIKTNDKKSPEKSQNLVQPCKNDFIEKEVEIKVEHDLKSSDLTNVQKRESSLISYNDTLENSSEIEDTDDKVGLDIKKESHITMCAGKTGATEGVSLNHKLETVANVVQDTILKDPLKVDHEGRPAMTAVLNLNQPSLPSLSEFDLESESEDEYVVKNVKIQYESVCEDVHIDKKVRAKQNKENKSSKVNVQILVQPSRSQIPDFIEENIELEQVSLAPVKSSESSPAQVGNEKGSEIAPAQTDQKHLDINKDDEHMDKVVRLKNDKEKTTSSVPVSSPPQANVKSNKRLKQKRLETVREGALMPDNIWLSNHMPNTRMSDKEYEANCKSLKKACNLSNECNAHSSLKNLKIISKNLNFFWHNLS